MGNNLKPGEVICDECNGVGHFGYTMETIEIERYNGVQRYPAHKEYDICDKCNGEGKLDWIEVVVGKRQPDHYINANLDFVSMYPSMIGEG